MRTEDPVPLGDTGRIVKADETHFGDKAEKTSKEPSCPICEGSSFEPGPGGRMTYGKPPRCVSCGSLERHRIIRRCFEALPKAILKRGRALQFAPDVSVDRAWFASFEESLYGIKNSLDIMNIDRADGSYDFVIANHVLEHVPDDRRALREMLRITSPSGVVQITIPVPMNRIETDDWGYPDAAISMHYRHYGSDFPLLMSPILAKFYGVQVPANDPVTNVADVVYFIGPCLKVIRTMARHMIGAGLIVLRIC